MKKTLFISIIDLLICLLSQISPQMFSTISKIYFYYPHAATKYHRHKNFRKTNISYPLYAQGVRNVFFFRKFWRTLLSSNTRCSNIVEGYVSDSNIPNKKSQKDTENIFFCQLFSRVIFTYCQGK